MRIACALTSYAQLVPRCERIQPAAIRVDTLPLVISTVAGSFLSGILITLLGHTGVMMAFGAVLTSTGAGLLTTLDVNATSSRWISYQILYGIGSGISRQTPTACVHHVLGN